MRCREVITTTWDDGSHEIPGSLGGVFAELEDRTGPQGPLQNFPGLGSRGYANEKTMGNNVTMAVLLLGAAPFRPVSFFTFQDHVQRQRCMTFART